MAAGAVSLAGAGEVPPGNDQLDQDLRYLNLAVSEGAELRGGQRVSRSAEGVYLAPALLVGTNNQHTVNREEVFGPVASVIRVGDYDEALAVANDTSFGLTAGIITRSLAAAHDFRRRSTAGMVMVNVATAGVDFHVLFGGMGASSYGPGEQGAAAREFYTRSKTSYVAARAWSAEARGPRGPRARCVGPVGRAAARDRRRAR